MSSGEPIFSVVIPTYNRLPMLKQAIASVDSQIFRNFEIIVSDDGSNDGTVEWLTSERPDVKVVCSGGRGAGGARNFGIAAASGRYISLLDSDDLWHPHLLELVSDALVHEPSSALVLVSETRFSEPSFPVWTTQLEVEKECYDVILDVAVACKGFAGTAVWGALRRDCFLKVGPFKEDRGINMEDLDWLFLAGDEGPAIRIISPQLLAYRLHDTQITKDFMQFYRSVELFLQREANGEYPLKEAQRRRNRIAEIARLPLNTISGRGALAHGIRLILNCGRRLGWNTEIFHLPRHLACTIRSAFFK